MKGDRRPQEWGEETESEREKFRLSERRQTWWERNTRRADGKTAEIEMRRGRVREETTTQDGEKGERGTERTETRDRHGER